MEPPPTPGKVDERNFFVWRNSRAGEEEGGGGSSRGWAVGEILPQFCISQFLIDNHDRSVGRFCYKFLVARSARKNRAFMEGLRRSQLGYLGGS